MNRRMIIQIRSRLTSLTHWYLLVSRTIFNCTPYSRLVRIMSEICMYWIELLKKIACTHRSTKFVRFFFIGVIISYICIKTTKITPLILLEKKNRKKCYVTVQKSKSTDWSRILSFFRRDECKINELMILGLGEFSLSQHTVFHNGQRNAGE